MINLRNAADRGHANYGWLDTYHTFSFNRYYDPKHMGFRSIRVINDDTVAPGAGFPTHGHENMEIVSWVLEGALEHRDNTGSGSVLAPGDVQRMSAGRGITHSEFNHSSSELLRFLQIWIIPRQRDTLPEYQEAYFPPEKLQGRLQLIVSPHGSEGSLPIGQDVEIRAARLHRGEKAVHRLSEGRHAWLQIAKGAVQLNGTTLGRGDGAAISDEKQLVMAADEDSEFLLFDLA